MTEEHESSRRQNLGNAPIRVVSDLDRRLSSGESLDVEHTAGRRVDRCDFHRVGIERHHRELPVARHPCGNRQHIDQSAPIRHDAFQAHVIEMHRACRDEREHASVRRERQRRDGLRFERREHLEPEIE